MFTSIYLLETLFSLLILHWLVTKCPEMYCSKEEGQDIPIKMKGFYYVEISIYSRAGFFIYLSLDFSQRYPKIFYITNKMQVFSQGKK